MKKIFTSLVLAFSFNVLAEPLNFVCITEFPTTTVVGFTENEKTTIRVIHHNGTKYMPIWSNIVVPNDFPILKETANNLVDLGDYLEFQMPADSCKMIDGMMFDCLYVGDTTQIINGKKVRMWSAYSTLINQKSSMMDYNYVETNISLSIDGKNHTIPMKYSEHECAQMNLADLKEHLKSKSIKI